MKRLLLPVFVFFLVATVQAQTAGDIAFVGWNSDGTDDVAFVTFANIPSGTTVFLRDDEYTNSTWDSAAEGTISWTAPASGIPAGTVVSIDQIINTNLTTTSTGTVAHVETGFDIINAENAVYMYKATIWSNAPFTFIAAFCNLATFGGLLDGTGLTDGTDAWSWGDKDNWKYMGIRTGTVAELKTAMQNSSNWTNADGTGDQSMTFDLSPFQINAADPNLPVITITNPATASISVGNEISNYEIDGVCNTSVIGHLSWTNSLTGSDGQFSAATDWTLGVNLNVGANLITVSGTNSEGVAANASVTITRSTTPPTNVQFTASSASVAESSVSYTVTVYKTLAEGSVSGEVGLSGTATEGGAADYKIDTTNFMMNAATTSATFTVTINDDTTMEPPETVILTLTNVVGGTVISPSVFTLTIIDDDIPPLVGDEILAFRFTAGPHLNVSTSAVNITVSPMGISAGTILTNVTTGTYFPNEPYIESTGGWASNSAETAKHFLFTITPTAGYALSVSGISFRAYVTLAGPAALSCDFAGGLATYTANATNDTLIVVSQEVTGVENQSAAMTVMIQGWSNGTRSTSGTGSFRLDDVVIYGSLFATGGFVDGIPVSWWDQYNIPSGQQVAANNPDSDGANNLEEYLADTNPTNSDSWLGFIDLDFSPAGPVITPTYKGGTQAVRIVEYTTNMLGGDWTPLLSNMPPTVVTNSFGNVPGHDVEFYRIRAHR